MTCNFKGKVDHRAVGVLEALDEKRTQGWSAGSLVSLVTTLTLKLPLPLSLRSSRVATPEPRRYRSTDHKRALYIMADSHRKCAPYVRPTLYSFPRSSSD